MPETNNIQNDFLDKLIGIIEKNISNEQFGVSELATEVGMSRSNLLRKIKKLTNLSVSQFIRQTRLKFAMELLKESTLTVSEISYEVGFGSTSYFTKCFHDFYGYPPGEVSKGKLNETVSAPITPTNKKRKVSIALSAIGLIIIIVFYLIFQPRSSTKDDPEKSIAVLPFKNDSNDPSNVYIVNGLMEAVLNNLQKIEDLQVISRTSVEKFRNQPKTIPELSKELNVRYFVEGSGQKIGDRILIHIQLIEASTDRHLWSEQFDREASDIFGLQQDIAKKIAENIQVIITPDEAKRIEKIPTKDLVAYDYFLKGLDQFYKGDREGLEEAIIYFNKAIEHDKDFARAYADIAMSYYYLDVFQIKKMNTDQINSYADIALLLDPKLPQSLIAKALYYMNVNEYDKAVPYLEKALEYNPNSSLVINFLSDFYTSYLPNTGKYLEYALKGIKLDIVAQDSVASSLTYLHLSNALIQSGFVEESEHYINRSIEFDPQNIYSKYVKAFILYAKHRDLKKTKEQLIRVLQKDSTRLDVLQEIGKICYYMRDYESSYHYYEKFILIKEAYQLDIYRSENAKIGHVLSEIGQTAESEQIFNDYFDYASNDNSIYKNLSLSVYYASKGEIEKAMKELEIFSKQDNYHYWTIIFLQIDPLVDNLKDLPEFHRTMDELETKFWKNHDQIKTVLKKKQLL